MQGIACKVGHNETDYQDAWPDQGVQGEFIISAG